ncbi:MAG: serine protein kinase RIO [Pseudomonadales bacterium]|nr:serine protein kinase RIO [Pseudomonadales bacterium]
MKIPKRLQPLVSDGLIDEVLSRLMSGKEADVYVVRVGTSVRCAKVYKESLKRSFKQAVTYQEGRKVKNSRRARAMEKGSKYGRQQQEAIWHNAEVDALYRLAAADVRVPEAYGCVDGVLIMELITDAAGDVAPRLADLPLSADQAFRDHTIMMEYVKRMLCAGMVHGDLSEFNVLVDDYGPVIIDLPQAVDAAGNNHAKSMLGRDVRNMTSYYGQYDASLLKTRYAEEMWQKFENGELHPTTELTGEFVGEEIDPDVDALLDDIHAVAREEEARLERLKQNDETPGY